MARSDSSFCKLVGLLCVCTFAAPLYAQKQTEDAVILRVDTNFVYGIDEVTVTARKTLHREVIPVQTMTGIELEKLSSHSVADAIRYFSGVQIKDFGGIGGLKTVNIRSMGTHHVGVFYDGIELGNAQNGQIDLGRFSLDNMEAITLYNGQKSTIFQPAKDFGSAGSVYLKSRTPEVNVQKRYRVKGTFKTGSFDVVNPSVLWEQRLNKNVDASLSTEYLYTSGRYKFRYNPEGGYDTTAIRRNGDVNSIRIESGLYGKISDGEWKGKVYLYNSERGLPGAIVRNKLTHEDRQWDTNLFLQSTFRKDVGDKYSLLLNGKYAYDYLHYLMDPSKDSTQMYVNNRYHQQEIYLSAANNYAILPYCDIALSTDFQWNGLDADLVDFPYPRRMTSLVSIAGSLHLDRFKLQASLLGTFVHERVEKDTLSASKKEKLTPALVASYKPFKKEDFHLRAFYKRIFRMPTLNDLYYTFIGNIYLEPEYTTQYNIGTTYSKNLPDGYLLKSLQAQVDAYYIEVENKIVAMPASNQFRWKMVNIGKVEIRGVDVALQSKWRLTHKGELSARLTYTYQKAQDFTDPEDPYYGGQISYIPWHSGSLILNGSLGKWDLNYSFIYTGNRYDISANIAENYIRKWYTSDISLARSFRYNQIDIRFTAEANNLFNQQFEVVRCYPMPGTNFKFILSMDI